LPGTRLSILTGRNSEKSKVCQLTDMFVADNLSFSVVIMNQFLL